MSSDKDIRWIQRLSNFNKALQKLSQAVELSNQRPLSDLEKQGLIEDGEYWMKMIQSRNKTSQTYNEETADEIVDLIVQNYQPLFLNFANTMNALTEKN